MVRRWAQALLCLLVTVAALGAGLATPAQAAGVMDGYDPGNLISDASFFNSGTMSDSAIRDFLASKGASCVAGPMPCLKDYRVDTPATPLTEYCAALPAVSNNSAAGIIGAVARACRINPQVLIALLQKESGLVTASGGQLTATAYARATGAGCPDFQPCDPAQATFFLQVYGAGERFQRYAKYPERFNVKARTTNQILYNPDTRCGRASVYVANQATAGLYNYTPFTADAAALGAVVGEGGYCSAYGNRNFFTTMKSWFPAAMTGSTQAPIVPSPTPTPLGLVIYAGHVQGTGWQRAVADGAMAGTTGQSLRLEALRLWVDYFTKGLTARGHVQDVGWQPWVTSGGVVGSTGFNRRLEAIEFKLTGQLAALYDIRYRAHVSGIGWQPYRLNGATAGTTGQARAIEAVEVELVPKTVAITYAAHVQNRGWLPPVTSGGTAGTTGQSLRLEALSLQLPSGVPADLVEWRGHVQDVGWHPWQGSGTDIGTLGRGLRLEALEVRLKGTAATTHTVRYRAHVQDVGWQNWVADGALAGTSGQSKRVEAVQMTITPRTR